jgi:hypothetical protein
MSCDTHETWKLLQSVHVCACKEVLEQKGVYVGWQNGNKVRMVKTVKVFLMEYWKKQGLLNDITCIQFKEDIEKMSFLIYKGIEYRVKDLVVVRPDGLEDSSVEDLGFWTWKARILSIFMHEFMGVHEIFFRAKYFEQVPSPEGSNLAEQSELSFMRV